MAVSRDEALHEDVAETEDAPVTGAALADAVTMAANALRECARHLDELAGGMFRAQVDYLVRKD